MRFLQSSIRVISDVALQQNHHLLTKAGSAKQEIE